VLVGTVALIVIARFITAVVVPAVFGGLLLAVLANVAVQTLASFVGGGDGGIRRPPRGPGRR
jgi:ABC-type proline/glycine betaine transport system permease subunit